MAKKSLDQMMAARSPLSSRQAVVPVDLYANATDEPVNQETSLEVNQQTTAETAAPSGATVTNRVQQGSKLVKKFASYLRPDSLRALKMVALEEERKDYQVLQEAVDEYLARKGKL